MKNAVLEYKFLIYPFVTVLAALFLLFIFILPQLKNFFEGQKNLTVMENRARVLEAKASDLESYDKDRLEERLGVALASLPTEKDLPVVLGILQSLSANSAVTLVSFQISGPQVSDPKSSSFGVKLDITGTTRALENFVESIEASYRVMKVSSVEVSPLGTSGQISSIVGVDVFFTPAPKEFGSIDEPLPKITEQDEEIIAKLATSETLAETLSPLAASEETGKSNPFE